MLTSDDWFSMAVLPAGRLQIRVRWGPYIVLAATDVDKRGRRHFHEIVGRELRPISARPEAWQPVAPAKWIWPNGVACDPLPVHIWPRMTTTAMAFDATAAAAEMEADREAARANPDAPVAEGPQWWRDVARVQYQPMGAIDAEHGEARIMRALILERSIRMDMRRYRTNAAVLADLKLTLADVLAEVPSADWVPALVPQPEDWRDFEVVMGWFVEVLPSRREMRCLRGRMQSPPATWVQIGDEIGRTEARARQLYDGAIDALVDAGNRRPRRAKARLTELQARNREARR